MEQGTYALGFLLIIVGGIMEGTFALSLKYTPKWEWENTWGAGSLMALLLVPWPLAFLTVPNLMEVYTSSPSGSLWAALLFGAGWGAGGIFFGLGVSAVGLSLGLSLIMGLIAVGGSIVPLMMEHPEQLTRPAGLVLMGGIATMILGLSIVAQAGRIKTSVIDSGARETTQDAPPTVNTPFKVGLIFCVAAGLLSALVNFGLIYGARIADAAVQQGATSANANNAVWALVFTSNYLVNVLYCAYLTRRRRTFRKFSEEGTAPYWGTAIFMGLLWAGGIVVYGMGATRVGEFGAFLGFPMMLISSILAGNVAGILTGEWTGTPGRAKRIMTVGVIALVLAVFLLAYSNQLIS